MLPTVSGIIPAEPLLGNPFTGVTGGFTPWENLESYFSSFDQSPSPDSEEVDHNSPNSGLDLSRYHVGSDSGSGSGLDDQGQILSNFDQTSLDHDPNQDSPDSNSVFYFESQINDPRRNSVRLNSDTYSNDSNSNSGLDEPKPVASIMDERKRRRMVSNRESARRSRMRKQRHLDNLRKDVNHVKLENRELTNQLQFVTHHINQLRRDNDQLVTESVILQRRLMELSRILQLQQLQQNHSISTNNIHAHAIIDSQLYHQ